MATVKCADNTYNALKFDVDGLQYNSNEYDKFVWRFFQPTGNGSATVEIITYTYDWNDELSDYPGFYFTFSNDGWKGNNCFTPNTFYILLLECYWDGVCYALPSVQFTTSAVNSPSGTIQPVMYPYVREQNYGTCVANCLSTAMEIFQYKNTGVSEKYSISYIFGSDGRTADDMFFEDTVAECKTIGSPRWELVSPYYPDEKTKANSVSTFNNASSEAKANGKVQRFSGYANIDFYDTDSVADYIAEYGFFMLNFRVPNNFYNVGSNGIVPQLPDSYSGANHSIALIGLTTKSGKKHWIAHNSWGDWWGDGGRCYIPYDWACGAVSPFRYNESAISSWTCECYAVWNTRTYRTNPSTPTITDATQTSNQKSMNVSWNGGTNTKFIVFARQYGDTNWWQKSITTNNYTTIPVDNYGEYQVMVIGMSSYDICSAHSNIVNITVEEEKPRPTNFQWWYTKSSGMDFNLTADEWIAFCDSVLAFLTYTENLNVKIGTNDLGLPADTTYYEMVIESKLEAIQGKDFTAKAFNYARYVIGSINGVGTGISKKYREDIIYASLLNTVVDKLNLI